MLLSCNLTIIDFLQSLLTAKGSTEHAELSRNIENWLLASSVVSTTIYLQPPLNCYFKIMLQLFIFI